MCGCAELCRIYVLYIFISSPTGPRVAHDDIHLSIWRVGLTTLLLLTVLDFVFAILCRPPIHYFVLAGDVFSWGGGGGGLLFVTTLIASNPCVAVLYSFARRGLVYGSRTTNGRYLQLTVERVHQVLFF